MKGDIEKDVDKPCILFYSVAAKMSDFIRKTIFGPNYRWWAMSIVALATLMTTMDNGLISISLPTIVTYFKADLSFAGWVFLTYYLVTASLLLPFGRLSDMIGRKRILSLGFLIYSFGSVMAGLSQSPAQLLAFRFIQSIGGAMMASNSFAIVVALFPVEERGRAMGIVGGTIAAVGFTLGPTLGGILVQTLGWRSVFYVSAPVAIIGFLLTQFILHEHRMVIPLKRSTDPFDILGTIFFSSGLSMFLFGVTTLQKRGWSSPLVLGELSVALVLLGIFVWREYHTRYPMLDLTLFRIRSFTTGNSARLASFMTMSMNNLLMPFYLQMVLGLSPASAGLVMIVNAIAQMIISPISGWLSDKISIRFLSSLGLAVNCFAFLSLSGLTAQSSYLDVIQKTVFLGIGIGLFQTPNNNSVMSSVPPNRLGVASAFLATIRSLGQSFGVTLATSIVTASLIGISGQSSLSGLKEAGRMAGDSNLVKAFIQGFRYCYWTAGGLCFLGIVLSWTRGTGENPDK